jgi:hypothetical protein
MPSSKLVANGQSSKYWYAAKAADHGTTMALFINYLQACAQRAPTTPLRRLRPWGNAVRTSRRWLSDRSFIAGSVVDTVLYLIPKFFSYPVPRP